MVELQALGAMGGQQQQPSLAAAHIPSPFGQPFDEVVHRCFRATGLQLVLSYGFSQQLDPGALGCPTSQSLRSSLFTK